MLAEDNISARTYLSIELDVRQLQPGDAHTYVRNQAGDEEDGSRLKRAERGRSQKIQRAQSQIQGAQERR